MRRFTHDRVELTVHNGTVRCPVTGTVEDLEACLHCSRLLTAELRDGYSTVTCAVEHERTLLPIPPG